MDEQKLRHIVRIVNTDIDGHKPLYRSLTKIKGVGVMYANIICMKAGIDREIMAGALNQDQMGQIDDIIKNPTKYKIPDWMMNKRRDYTDGVTKHLTSGDLEFSQEKDIRKLKRIRAYRGWRHILGQPVRGQRTRSNFRHNKGRVVGVKKRSGVKAGRV